MSPLPRFSPLLGSARVVPVLTIERFEDAVPLAEALHAGGLSVIEVTLRTKAALRACEAIAAHCPEVVLGVGTVLAPSQVKEARDAGARFLVTPGTSARLAVALAESGLPVLPGAASVSEMLALMELGFHEVKFFPAEAAGGIDYLKSVAGPLGDLKFCPTGGIGAKNAPDYLALKNVLCVGGSWVAPGAALAEGDWPAITRLAAAAATLGR